MTQLQSEQITMDFNGHYNVRLKTHCMLYLPVHKHLYPYFPRSMVLHCRPGMHLGPKIYNICIEQELLTAYF